MEGDDGLIDAVVEGAEELGPEEGLETAVLEYVAKSAVRHAVTIATRRPIGGRKLSCVLVRVYARPEAESMAWWCTVNV